MCGLLALDDRVFHTDFCIPNDLLQLGGMSLVSVCGWPTLMLFLLLDCVDSGEALNVIKPV